MAIKFTTIRRFTTETSKHQFIDLYYTIRWVKLGRSARDHGTDRSFAGQFERGVNIRLC